MEIYNLSTFTNRINERKGDNLHQFVQYMREYGQEDVLKSCHFTAQKAFSRNTFDIESAIGYLDNYTLSELVYDYLYENDILDDYEIESPEDMEDMDDPMSCVDDMYNFNEYCINRAEEQIFDDLEEDNRNMIYIEREICVPKFTNRDKFYDLLKNDYKGKLGIYWTYCRGNAQAQWGIDNTGEAITLFGYVSPDDVDWEQTILNNLLTPDEKELTLNDDATVEIDCVKTETGHIIFNGHLLYKA